MTNPTNKIFHPRRIIITLAIILCCYNFFYLLVYARQKYNDKTDYVNLEPGSQFDMFLPHLKGVEKIGYLTDKEVSREKNDGFWLQAQYFLAPTIIDPSGKIYDYNIIDSNDREYLITIMRANRFGRLANNLYGQGLVVKQ